MPAAARNQPVKTSEPAQAANQTNSRMKHLRKAFARHLLQPLAARIGLPSMIGVEHQALEKVRQELCVRLQSSPSPSHSVSQQVTALHMQGTWDKYGIGARVALRATNSGTLSRQRSPATAACLCRRCTIRASVSHRVRAW